MLLRTNTNCRGRHIPIRPITVVLLEAGRIRFGIFEQGHQRMLAAI